MGTEGEGRAHDRRSPRSFPRRSLLFPWERTQGYGLPARMIEYGQFEPCRSVGAVGELEPNCPQPVLRCPQSPPVGRYLRRGTCTLTNVLVIELVVTVLLLWAAPDRTAAGTHDLGPPARITSPLPSCTAEEPRRHEATQRGLDCTRDYRSGGLAWYVIPPLGLLMFGAFFVLLVQARRAGSIVPVVVVFRR